MAREATAIKAGPAMNLIAIASTASRTPHAIILVRDAINRPIRMQMKLGDQV